MGEIGKAHSYLFTVMGGLTNQCLSFFSSRKWKFHSVKTCIMDTDNSAMKAWEVVNGGVGERGTFIVLSTIKVNFLKM